LYHRTHAEEVGGVEEEVQGALVEENGSEETVHLSSIDDGLFIFKGNKQTARERGREREAESSRGRGREGERERAER